MAAVDVIITLAIVIKIVDIFVVRHKNKIKEICEKPNTTSPNKIPVIIAIIIILAGIAATNQKENNPKPIHQINATYQTPPSSYLEKIYIKPKLNATTEIINTMGKRMIENTKRVQQEAQRKVSKANQ